VVKVHGTSTKVGSGQIHIAHKWSWRRRIRLINFFLKKNKLKKKRKKEKKGKEEGKFMFEGVCSDVVMDSHVRGRLLSIHL